MTDKGRLSGSTHALEDAEAYCPTCDESYGDTLDTCPRDGSALVRFPAVNDSLVGRIIDDRFHVRERLGEGGMGVVYKGWQASVDREVAIKVVHPRLAHQRASAKRFLREARLASRLSQRNTVVIHDFGQTEDGLLYLVMELLQGRTLAAFLAETPRVAPAIVADVGAQLCEALDEAHRLDIVHRDLKPSNVFLVEERPTRLRIKVVDFGLAKSVLDAGAATSVTGSGAVIGTPRYMAPETISDGAADGRSDLYSLGVLLHEMLAGAPPFAGVSPEVVFARQLHEEPPALHDVAAPALARIVDRLLRKSPDERYQTAAEVRDELEAARRALTAASDATTGAPRTAADFRPPTRAATRPAEPDSAATADATPRARRIGKLPGPRGRAKRLVIAGGALAAAVVAAVAAWIAWRPAAREADTRAASLPAVTPSPGAPSPVAPSLAAPSLAAPSPAAPSPAAPSPAAPSPAVAGPAVASPAAPTAATVLLDLQATPRARVWIDGRAVGSTPLSTPVPRGDRAVEVIFRRSGYASEHRRVVPTADTKVRVELHRAAGRGTGDEPPPTEFVLPEE